MTNPSCPRCGADLSPAASPAGLCPACLLAAALSDDAAGAESSAGPSTTLLPGTEVGQFRILGLLGKGGMATVYRAHDARLERTVALKVLPPEFLYDGTFARRFEQEARVVAKLEHANIVPIYASGIDEGIPWMSIRLLAGGSLGTLLAGGRPAPRDAVRMLRCIADALDYAHTRGVVHRDIKPSNVLLDGSGGVFLGDFGLAHMLEGDGSVTRTGTLIGTPHYMAPEQALGEPVDHHCDIYSLGIVAYEMFVGATPFSGESPMAVLLKHVNQPVPTPPGDLVSRPVMSVIQRAVAKVPAERWSSAGAFVSALEVAAGVAPVGLRPAGSGANRHVGRSSLRGLGAAAAVLAAVGLTWWATREPPLRERPSQSSDVERSDTPAQDAIVTDDPPPTETLRPPTTASALVPLRPRPEPAAAPARQPATVTTAPLSPGPAATYAAPPPAALPTTVLPEPPPAAPPPVERADPVELTPPAPVVLPSPAPVIDTRTPPVLVRPVTPDYPAAARAAQIEGDVLLQATVGPDGRVGDVTVLRSVHPLVDEAARNAVLRYEYTPGQRNGVPESTTLQIRVSFRLR